MKKYDEGISLIEVMVSFLLLAIILGGLGSVIAGSTRGTIKGSAAMSAAVVGNEQMEKLQSLSVSQWDDGPTVRKRKVYTVAGDDGAEYKVTRLIEIAENGNRPDDTKLANIVIKVSPLTDNADYVYETATLLAVPGDIRIRP